MKEKFRVFNQYGFNLDAFDTYRESVTRSYQGTMKVFSLLACVVALNIIVIGFLNHQPEEGLIFCLLLLAAGAFGTAASFRKNCTQAMLRTAGYMLCIATYAIAIYGAVTYKTEAYWVGAILLTSLILFDYAWRICALQILSYLSLQASWLVVDADPVVRLFIGIYLLISLVSFYTLNRSRIQLIVGQQKSQYQADTDLLTGLTMRTAAQQQIEESLKTDEHGVMLLLDLDRFKSVNDRLGHQMGDTVLIDVAADLKRMFRNSDVLSRLGGDEFVVYMNSVPEKEWATDRAAQVVRTVRRWVGNGTTNIQISASIGIVMTDMVPRTYDDLYRAADIAMYAAKSQGGNRALFYSPEMLEHAEEMENARHLTREQVKTEEEMDALR